MIIIPIDQGTDEWHDLRRSKIGASDCPAIMEENPHKTPMQLWREKICGSKPFVSEAMQRGSSIEPLARGRMSAKYGVGYQPLVVQSDEYDWMIASLDCFAGSGNPLDCFADAPKLIEIKCPNEQTFQEIKEGNYPRYYFWQIQHQLYVTNLQQATLFAFNGSEGHETIIQRDDEAIALLIEKEKAFYKKMLNFDPPEEKIPERVEPDVLEAIQAYKEAKRVFDETEEYLKICRDSLIYLANDLPYQCQGIRVTKCVKSGTVDYAKVPELKGIDLTPYRKAPSEYWKILS